MCRFSLFASLKQYSHDHLHIITALDEPLTRTLQIWGTFLECFGKSKFLQSVTIFSTTHSCSSLAIMDIAYSIPSTLTMDSSKSDRRSMRFACRNGLRMFSMHWSEEQQKLVFRWRFKGENLRSGHCLQSTRNCTKISAQTHCDQWVITTSGEHLLT